MISTIKVWEIETEMPAFALVAAGIASAVFFPGTNVQWAIEYAVDNHGLTAGLRG